MYQYFNGLVIREGTEGIPAKHVEALFEDVGWARNTSDWQIEMGLYCLGSKSNDRHGKSHF